jgi:hypothetical protein
VQLLYLPGLKNVVANFLSRPNQTATGSVTATLVADQVDFEEMAPEQNRCPEMQRLLGGTSLKLAFRQTGAQRPAGDVSTGNFRPIVPLKFRKIIFDHFDDVAHLGRLASRRIISSRFVWRAEVGTRNFFLSPQSQFRNLKETLPQSQFRNFLKQCCSATATPQFRNRNFF